MTTVDYADDISQRFIHGIEELGLNVEKVKQYRYAGGSPPEYVDRWKFIVGDDCPNPLECGIRHDHCVCGQRIIRQFWIVKDPKGDLIEDDTLLVIGSECIDKFIYSKKAKLCNNCGVAHKNRLVNLCNDCDPDKQPKEIRTCNFCETRVRGEDTCCAKHRTQNGIHTSCYQCKKESSGYYECYSCKYKDLHECFYGNCNKKVKRFKYCYDCNKKKSNNYYY